MRYSIKFANKKAHFMKKQTNTLMILLLFAGIAMLFGYCKKPDQEINPPAVSTPAPTPPSANQLTAIYTATTFDMSTDWTLSSAWTSAPVMECSPVVPNPGNNLFAGYIGRTFDVKMKAMYDSTYIYFLVQYDDVQKSVARPWYFDTVSRNWKQEGSSPAFDANGVMTRSAFQEDKFGVLWNINNSCEAFKTQTCYGSCHLFTAYRNNAGVMVPNASGNHYTNVSGEKIDMWHMRLVKDAAFGKGSDEYQDYCFGPGYWDTLGGNANGRHTDGQIPAGVGSTYTYAPGAYAIQGAIASQSLQSNKAGAAGKRSVPSWYVLDPSTYKGGQFYIDIADTGGTNAGVVYIIGVDSMGVMTYSLTRTGAAAGTIDPSTTDFMPGAMTGANYSDITLPPTDGKKCQPSNYASALSPGRDDIDLKTTWAGGKCFLQIRRKLTTGDLLKQDIDFKGYHPAGDALPTTPSSSGIWFQDQPFGIAIFNNANNQHAIKPNLLLHFKTN